MRAVQPQLHDDGLGLFAFEHVVAEPVGPDDNAEKLSLLIKMYYSDANLKRKSVEIS